jgi:N-acetylglucosamine malate deacetylase 1
VKRLIIAPHADDETFGCGGLIAKHASECYVVVVARPDDQRLEEFGKAMYDLCGPQRQMLGTELLNRRDGEVGLNPGDLVSDLDIVLNEVQPDEVYLPFPDLHQDHIAVYEAGMRACRVSMTPRKHVPDAVLVYEVPVYDLQLYPTDLRFNVFEELEGNHARLKATALGEYESQAVRGRGSHPSERESVLAHARTVGAAHRVGMAEQYALVRQVRR